MNSSFQAEEPSTSAGQKVIVTIALLVAFGIVLWKRLEKTLRLISGR